MGRVIAVLLALLLSGLAVGSVIAAPLPAIDASPELQYYPCHTSTFGANWSVNATGAYWYVIYDDGTTSPHYSPSKTTVSHVYYLNQNICDPRYPAFKARDNIGNTATDNVKVGP